MRSFNLNINQVSSLPLEPSTAFSAGHSTYSATGGATRSPAFPKLKPRPKVVDDFESLCQSVELPVRTEWGLDILGRMSLENGNLADAMDFFQKELDQSKRSDDPVKIAEAANDLAYVCLVTGNNERAARLYELALHNWRLMDMKKAMRSPKVISEMALFLHDYADFLTIQGKYILAARTKKRLEKLAKRFSPFTVYSAVSTRIRKRGQIREARIMLDLARNRPVNPARAAADRQLLESIDMTP